MVLNISFGPPVHTPTCHLPYFRIFRNHIKITYVMLMFLIRYAPCVVYPDGHKPDNFNAFKKNACRILPSSSLCKILHDACTGLRDLTRKKAQKKINHQNKYSYCLPQLHSKVNVKYRFCPQTYPQARATKNSLFSGTFMYKNNKTNPFIHSLSTVLKWSFSPRIEQ